MQECAELLAVLRDGGNSHGTIRLHPEYQRSEKQHLQAQVIVGCLIVSCYHILGSRELKVVEMEYTCEN